LTFRVWNLIRNKNFFSDLNDFDLDRNFFESKIKKEGNKLGNYFKIQVNNADIRLILKLILTSAKNSQRLDLTKFCELG
jgi:hypothetical protein